MISNRHFNLFNKSSKSISLSAMVIAIGRMATPGLRKYLIIIALTLIACNQEEAKNETLSNSSVDHESASTPEQHQGSLMEFEKQKTVQTTTDFLFSDQSFKTFYERFIQDSLFQIERVRFPLKGQYESFDGERKWSKNKWSFMNWDFRENMYDGDDSTSIIQDSCKFFYGAYCRECGFSFEMEFQKLNDKWFLTYRQENNY